YYRRMNFILRIVVTGLVAYFLQKILSGVHIASWQAGIGFALLLSLMNALLKPILEFISFPITCISFGLYLFVINALMVMATDYFICSVKIDCFWWALIFSLLLSLVSGALSGMMKKERR